MGLLKLVKYIARFYWILMLVMHALNYRAGVHSWLQNHAEYFTNFAPPPKKKEMQPKRIWVIPKNVAF